VREKYGHVAQIITFGTLKARAAIRDVCRVHEIPLGDADKLAKLVPEELKITIDKALEQEPELKSGTTPTRRARVIDTGACSRGRRGTRACTPRASSSRRARSRGRARSTSSRARDDVITQWDGPTCEKMGLLKMDFLGLRTLSIIERAKKLIRETLPEEIWTRGGARRRLPVRNDPGRTRSTSSGSSTTDQHVFDLFQRGDTTGVFQFESGGMRRLLSI
jgi:DNA polymerase-3 subunit alpha